MTPARIAIALAAGFGWQARRPSARTAHRAPSLACIDLPLAVLALPPVQGSIQRAMDALVFAWRWARYPRCPRS